MLASAGGWGDGGAVDAGEGMPHRLLHRPWLIGISLAVLVFIASHYGFLDVLELKSLDVRFRLRGPLPSRLPIVIVSIDQDSFDELGLSWPWPRTLHAELIQKLAVQQATLIALDILFAEPKADPAEDHALAEAIQMAGNVVLAAEYTQVPGVFGPKLSMNLPIPLLRERALGYGPVNVLSDQDGVIRSALLELPFQDRVYSAFAYQVYQRIIDRNKLVADERLFSQPQVYYINYRGPARSYPIVPYYRVLRDELEPSFFKDKIVLVGALAASLHDLYPTPFSANQPTAGAEIQANFIDTLAANDPIRPLPARSHALLFTLLAALTIGCAVSVKPLRAFGLIVGLCSLYAILTLVLFARYQWWIPVVPPLLAVLLSYGGITLDNYIREQRERLRLRTIFGRYVSPDVVHEILENREGLGLHGRRRHITVLFSDIRGFTSISEQIDPEQVVAFLSEYLAQATQIVFKHGGTVDKFIGDAIMALFGAPKSHGNDALRAVRAGLEMVALVASLGSQWRPILGRPLQVGIGINSGEAVVGSIGSEMRSDFTAIGDAVNLASRLEGLTKEFGIPLIISEYTAAELGGQLPLKPLGRVRVTGREAPLVIYTVAEQVDTPAKLKTAT
jgi:adenylate cyclase